MSDSAPEQPEQPSLGDRLFCGIQWLLPTLALSRGMYAITQVSWAPFKNTFIKIFQKGFGISLDEAVVQEPAKFATFNEFFTRELKADARPIAGDSKTLVSPVDGTISQFGAIENGCLIQAKGIAYRLEDLLAQSSEDVAKYRGGQFMTIYLAPYNYHRIHAYCDMSLTATSYAPGRLFSVNPATARTMKNLFGRNERVICHVDTPAGPSALVLVGALFVGSMETVWHGQITPPHNRKSPLPPANPGLRNRQRGEEVGRFNMGSTVVLVFPPDAVQFDQCLKPGQAISMGNAIGKLLK